MRFNLLKIAKEEEATEQWNFFSFSSSIYILERESGFDRVSLFHVWLKQTVCINLLLGKACKLCDQIG